MKNVCQVLFISFFVLVSATRVSADTNGEKEFVEVSELPEIHDEDRQEGEFSPDITKRDSESQDFWFKVNGNINFRPFLFAGANRAEINRQCLRFGQDAGIVFVQKLIIYGDLVNSHASRIEGVCKLISERARNFGTFQIAIDSD